MSQTISAWLVTFLRGSSTLWQVHGLFRSVALVKEAFVSCSQANVTLLEIWRDSHLWHWTVTYWSWWRLQLYCLHLTLAGQAAVGGREHSIIQNQQLFPLWNIKKCPPFGVNFLNEHVSRGTPCFTSSIHNAYLVIYVFFVVSLLKKICRPIYKALHNRNKSGYKEAICHQFSSVTKHVLHKLALYPCIYFPSTRKPPSLGISAQRLKRQSNFL